MPKETARTTEHTTLPQSVVPNTKGGDFLFKLVGDFRRSDRTGRILYPKHTIANTEVVNDPETGLPRLMRLLRGVKTLWADEQKVDEKFVNNMRPTLSFVDGFLKVRSTDKLTFQFLMMKECCENNKNRTPGAKVRYRYLQPENEDSKDLKVEERRREAMEYAASEKEDEMVYHASYLNINMTSETGGTKTMKGIRAAYMKFAYEYPDVFLKSAGSEGLKYQYKVSKNISTGDIVVDMASMSARWRSGLKICVLPEGCNPAEYLADYALLPEGKEFKVRLLS